MDIEAQLRGMLVLQDPGMPFTDGVMTNIGNAPVGRLPAGIARLSDARARRKRFVLVVAMATLAVAAAMLPLVLTGSAGRQAGPQAAPAHPASSQADDAAATQVLASPSQPMLAASATANAESSPPAAAVLVVMPVFHRPQTRASLAALEAFRASLLHELGGMRDLVVVDGSTMDAMAIAAADYRISITSLTGGGPFAASGPGQRVDASIRFINKPLNGSAAITFRVDDQGTPLDIECSGSFRIGSDAANRGAGDLLRVMHSSRCSTAGIAAALAGFVRPQVRETESPPQRELIARVRDVTLAEAERSGAMWQLISARPQNGRTALDRDAMAAIVDFINELSPAGRLKWWRMVGALDNSAVVPPLLEVLRGDPDETVRLEAVTLLARAHSGKGSVNIALERASREDAHYLVRVAAARAVSRHADSKARLLAVLADESQPASARLAAVLHTDLMRREGRAMLNDEQVILPLVQLVRDNRSDPSQLESSRLLARISESRHPAVTNLLTDMLLEPAHPATGQLAADAVHGLLQRLDEPGVRDILEQLVVGAGDPRMRDRIERELAENDARWPD